MFWWLSYFNMVSAMPAAGGSVTSGDSGTGGDGAVIIEYM
jgi:hypothetical protein